MTALLLTKIEMKRTYKYPAFIQHYIQSRTHQQLIHPSIHQQLPNNSPTSLQTNRPTSPQCSSPPSPSPPSQPSPPPLPSRSVRPSSSALLSTSAQPSTLPSAASWTSTASPLSPALLVSLEILDVLSLSQNNPTDGNITAESDLTTVADFVDSCAAEGLSALCCTVPVVCISRVPKTQLPTFTDTLQAGLGLLCAAP